jgi:y4mF family transcriptional regulator
MKSNSNDRQLANFVKEKRKVLGLTQQELSVRVGVGLRFIRDLEQGKQSLQLDKVNVVLNYFGYQLGAIPLSDRT